MLPQNTPPASAQGPVPPPVAPAPAQPAGVPTTRAEVNALRAQRSELSNQLQSAQRRRNEVVEQLAEASPAERAGLEARLKLLDERILEIESEISRTGQLMAQTPGGLLTTQSTQAPNAPPFTNANGTAVGVVFTLFVLAPLAITAARLMWRRATHGAVQKVDHQLQERLHRLEQGVDAVAIEVERISESQRFLTKLLSEREKQGAIKS